MARSSIVARPRGAARARLRSLLLALAALVLLKALAAAQEATPAPVATPAPAWTTRAPMLAARSEFAAAVVGADVYVAGGFGGGDRVNRFDTAGGTWRPVADLPEAVHHPGVAALDGRVYLAGGYSLADATASAAVWAYDPASDTWQRRADLPTPRGALGLAALDGKLYAVGGTTARWGGPASGAVEVY